ncbi:MAG: hypothetical protein ACYS5V_05415, partial [Planctomycetota bacterium]
MMPRPILRAVAAAAFAAMVAGGCSARRGGADRSDPPRKGAAMAGRTAGEKERAQGKANRLVDEHS